MEMNNVTVSRHEVGNKNYVSYVEIERRRD